MDHSDDVAEDMPRPCAAPADLPARCGAMIRQRADHGSPSSPQQFIRLVGGHRRPVRAAAAPALSE